MNKRKFAPYDGAPSQKWKRASQRPDAKKHSLDSDEEDEYDEAQEKLDEDDIEGEEDGRSRQDEGVRMTAFNMKEEMEEGHFDKQGHFIWKNEREIRDSWLDNVEWHKIQDDSKYNLTDDATLGAESESDDEGEAFDETSTYRSMLRLMRPKETVNKTIRRLGGGQKLSSVERLRRKKAGTLNDNPDLEALTGFADSILTNAGNMDVYQETFEQISAKVDAKSKPKEPELDMYADDFTDKEQRASTSGGASEVLKWEFKRDQDKDDVEGPYDTQQMIKYASEGHFKTGVWVRKCGEQNFYSSHRIDFELYD